MMQHSPYCWADVEEEMDFTVSIETFVNSPASSPTVGIEAPPPPSPSLLPPPTLPMQVPFLATLQNAIKLGMEEAVATELANLHREEAPGDDANIKLRMHLVHSRDILLHWIKTQLADHLPVYTYPFMLVPNTYQNEINSIVNASIDPRTIHNPQESGTRGIIYSDPTTAIPVLGHPFITTLPSDTVFDLVQQHEHIVSVPLYQGAIMLRLWQKTPAVWCAENTRYTNAHWNLATDQEICSFGFGIYTDFAAQVRAMGFRNLSHFYGNHAPTRVWLYYLLPVGTPGPRLICLGSMPRIRLDQFSMTHDLFDRLEQFPIATRMINTVASLQQTITDTGRLLTSSGLRLWMNNLFNPVTGERTGPQTGVMLINKKSGAVLHALTPVALLSSPSLLWAETPLNQIIRVAVITRCTATTPSYLGTARALLLMLSLLHPVEFELAMGYISDCVSSVSNQLAHWVHAPEVHIPLSVLLHRRINAESMRNAPTLWQMNLERWVFGDVKHLFPFIMYLMSINPPEA